jgi:hypothetical protein
MLGRTMSILWTSDCIVRHLTNVAVIDLAVIARLAAIRELRNSRPQTTVVRVGPGTSFSDKLARA